MTNIEITQNFIENLEKAREELLYAPKYDYLVVNDSVEEAATDILQIIAAEQIRHRNKEEKVKEVLES